MSAEIIEPKETIPAEEFCTDILERMSADLSMIIDREFSIEEIKVSRANKRAEGKDNIHISFRLGFRTPQGRKQGCVLIPLPDAVALSAYLMMMPDEEVKECRSMTTLDSSTKDAMLEVGNFIGGASDAVVRGLFPAGFSVRFEGCQGVREDVRPALEYEEGDELVIVESKSKIHDLAAFDLMMVVPLIGIFE
ncbi:MAG: hypothetical protein ACI8QS_001823 [Planctomycetota bacterium]|jgi:hypothetical protein